MVLVLAIVESRRGSGSRLRAGSAARRNVVGRGEVNGLASWQTKRCRTAVSDGLWRCFHVWPAVRNMRDRSIAPTAFLRAYS